MKTTCSQHVGQFQINSVESVTFILIRFLSNYGEQRSDGWSETKSGNYDNF